jgi:16S rRNA (cytosine967-C5)-methyltransferase
MHTTRELALAAVHDIWERDKKPKDVLEDLSEPLEKRDRAFLMELVYGVVRFRDTLDWALREFLRKPSGLGPDTLNNLRLAVYQLLFTRVPRWAAVNEAVEMEKRGGRPELVNAVLRNFLRNLDSLLDRMRDMRADRTVKYIAALTSHPRWLIERWVKRFGADEALELADANNRIPSLTLRVNTLKGMKQQVINELLKIGIEGEPTTFSPVGIKLKGFHIYKEIFFLKGLIMVQDEASQLISCLLDPQPGETILDACAAPGGKTTHIAQLMQDSGEITAVDSDRKRMDRLRENVSNLGLSSIRAVQADILEYMAKEPFDRILLDAPCSALGVIRRHPDVKYRHKSQDLLKFRANQLRILRHMSKFLKPGGSMVYSVCSTEPEEGEEVIKEFLKDSEDFYIIDTTLPFLKGFMKDGFLRTYPHIDDMDGFFGVRLCRKA